MAHCGITSDDAVRWTRDYSGELFHGLLCDPPYHLTSIVKRFGAARAAPAKHGRDGAFRRASRGFMNQTWDGGDVAFRPETWASFGTVLHPGAFGFAFASTRGLHRMMVAIEDAGFTIHPIIFVWTFANGFPKATRVKGHPEFAGHRYGGQALKPALEPIICFQKPYQGKPAENIVSTGAGALNIEAGRILHNEPSKTTIRTAPRYVSSMEGVGRYAKQSRIASADSAGRWASNFILSHTPDCVQMDQGWQCDPCCPVQALGEQSGVNASGMMKAGTKRGKPSQYFNAMPEVMENDTYGDSGTAARYFFNADFMLERLEDADPVIYAAKASAAEREAGLHGFEQQQVRTTYDTETRIAHGNDSGRPRRNTHPTIKPIALAQHLASLLLPPAEYAPRRLFVPFAGAGSEMIGAMRAGWEYIQGVELTPAYIPIAQARFSYWRNIPAGRKQPVKAAAQKTPADGSKQLNLFEQGES